MLLRQILQQAVCQELVPLSADSEGQCESLRAWLRAGFVGEKNYCGASAGDEEKALRAQREEWHEPVEESEQGPGDTRECSGRQAEQEGQRH